MSGADVWAVMPAAGRGTRFGGPTPKQYLQAGGRPLLAHALDALLAHPRVAGAMVALAAVDEDWPGWSERGGKPVLTCTGGGERADSVLAALHALPESAANALVLVHDAARPNLDHTDLERLIEAAENSRDGAILAAPVRDTLKRATDDGRIAATEPRERLWRALTPQAFRRQPLAAALQAARDSGVVVTDEAMAMERQGLRPRLVEGREDNFKVTTPADLERFRFILSQRGQAARIL
ncbi:2-C-methyl-D-erythritol 4-phosphate cytidylyltransferase [Marilutibacter maris]|uniref:2-C-methyl-D-erythritol 4-phosphate cytidylyltransferase n=2 Tax=Marilutibacter maris TaxID=1605891 RepID=A0A2U9TIA5_9GAMM|nr:2-C-methyl-D-erythritol 4-phosphate cytidylyltransferase [Lysobacter maris]AWV07840.1 2-C-methyl-D-erythritol 4-phosphate cytidylyltransferase [Lysobacter maris]